MLHLCHRWLEAGRKTRGELVRAVLALLIGCCGGGRTLAQTETFIDRYQATDLRIVSFNVSLNTIFPDANVKQAEKFVRIVNALDADILNLQEVSRPPAEVAALLNAIAPLHKGTWQTHQEGQNIIASKYPLSMFGTAIDSPPARLPALALVDLPEARFPSDLYLINHHYICCGLPGSALGHDRIRQRSSDAVMRWIRDARTAGGLIDLPPGTPIAIVGDLNNVGGVGPLDTLITGDISDELVYGRDFPPDWDESPFAEAHPRHNGSGVEDYTFRSAHSLYDRTRIDHIIYSDSAMDLANRFVLNTVAMSAVELEAAGLQTFDVTIDSTGLRYDHLPVIADFRLFDFAESDFNFDRLVDEADVALWANDFHLGHGGDSDGDDDADGADFLIWQRRFPSSDPISLWEQNFGAEVVADADLDSDADGADFLVWQRSLTFSPAVTTVPEPSAWMMAMLLFFARCRFTKSGFAE